MAEPSWDDKLNFLKAIRTGWCNNDYIEFLIERVWKINKPVNILDFGCGFGYVGLLMLPILPEGSTYTGIDISEKLLGEAQNIFENLGYSAEFVKADLNEYQPQALYDIAISQAVLRHIPNAEAVLEKMKQSVVQGGLVICMENDLEIEKAGQYFSGFDYTELGIQALYRKMYKKELCNQGRDYRFGIKIPILMQRLGLRNVGVRMNDCVKFLNPYGDMQEYNRQYTAIVEAWGWDKQLSMEDKIGHTNSLVERGLSRQEAEMFVAGEMKISDYVVNHKDNAFIVQVPGTLISYGTK